MGDLQCKLQKRKRMNKNSNLNVMYNFSFFSKFFERGMGETANAAGQETFLLIFVLFFEGEDRANHKNI